MSKRICIVGAGPAGLTAAYELVKNANDSKTLIIEGESQVGGISKTVLYQGNRIDIGGHRFFSKSERVLRFWQDILPLESADYRSIEHDKIMMLRNRLSRILFGRRFYDYPLALSVKTLCNLGLKRTFRIGMSYLISKIQPITKEKSLADFFINRFGQELYATFFQGYTEKVWGVKCEEIPRDWGAQRVKGLSVTSAILHALRSMISRVDNQRVETSLIDQFHYPKYGPGQLWEEVAQRVTDCGGTIQMNTKVVEILASGNRITGIVTEDITGGRQQLAVDCLLSSMSVKDLIAMLPDVPYDIQQIAEGLPYRDFITVGVLLDKQHVVSLPDNWIYIQEPDLKVGRIQVFNNWSPFLVADEHTVWLGLEYFCQESDDFWNMADEALKQLAAAELTKIGFIENTTAVSDSTVLKVKKAYPAYFGTYSQFEKLKSYLGRFDNLFLIGRNGQHRYNNMDHSMLTAMTAVDVLMGRVDDKNLIWQVNTEEDYHEKK